MPGVGVGGLSPADGEPEAAKPDDDAEPTEPEDPPFYIAPRYDFMMQFCWQENQLTERLTKRREQREAAENNASATGPASMEPDATEPTGDGAAAPTGG